MSEEDVKTLLNELRAPNDTKTETPPVKTEESTTEKKKDLFLIPNDSQLHGYIMKRLPIMLMYSGKFTDGPLDEFDVDWNTGGTIDLMDNWGIIYESKGENIYVRTLQGLVNKIQKSSKTVSSGLIEAFRRHYGLSGNANKNKSTAINKIVELLESYELPGEISKNGIAKVWTKPTSTELNPLTERLQITNPESDEIRVQQVKVKPSRGPRGKKQSEPEPEEQPQPNAEEPQPNAEEPQPNAEEDPQVVPANNGAIAKPDGENRIVINPQALNDLQTNQQLAATKAINTELLNTKHQLEQQQKILEKQNEILTAKDEFEKKLLNDKKILRYIEAEDTFSFNELVNTIDEALSKPGKEADDFLIASAVQSVLNKRDALEKLRDNERRKKSSQWSKAKIKDIHVEVQRDNNISPLMARTIASIS